MILATDGLWDYLSDQEAVDIVTTCMPTEMLRGAKDSSITNGGSNGNNGNGSSGGGGADGSAGAFGVEKDRAKWELLAADRLVQRALEIAAAESGITIEQLKALPIGRARRSRHDDTTAVVMFF